VLQISVINKQTQELQKVMLFATTIHYSSLYLYNSRLHRQSLNKLTKMHSASS